MEKGISPTSSKKMVPPLAVSKSPGRILVAPVKASFSCPNSSFASKSSEKEAQLMGKNIFFRPVAESMNRRSNQFFACAGFAGDKHI